MVDKKITAFGSPDIPVVTIIVAAPPLTGKFPRSPPGDRGSVDRYRGIVFGALDNDFDFTGWLVESQAVGGPVGIRTMSGPERGRIGWFGFGFRGDRGEHKSLLRKKKITPDNSGDRR